MASGPVPVKLCSDRMTKSGPKDKVSGLILESDGESASAGASCQIVHPTQRVKVVCRQTGKTLRGGTRTG